jgi:hypothetical protein
MTVTPNAPTNAGQAPRWLRVVTGGLLFLVLWVALVLVLFATVPLVRAGALAPALFLSASALPAGVAAWLMVRRASARLLAPLAVIVLVGIGGFGVWLAAAPMRGPQSGASTAPREPPRPTAEIPLPAPPPPPRVEPTPVPAPTPTAPSAPAPSPLPAEEAPGGGGGPSRAETIPQFPWPPPAASATYVLPETVFERGRTTGQVVATIIAALERKGYVERSFFTTPADGVVLVTRLERINEDGSSAADLQRWPAVGEAARSSVGFAQFLRGLFYVDPGRYRVIVFVLQDAPFSQAAEKPVTGQQARAWLRTGANVLPRELADRGYRGDCTVLVYEFASDGTAVRVVESRLTGLQHLEKSGVLATLGRPN